jgi:hypothetical protein
MTIILKQNSKGADYLDADVQDKPLLTMRRNRGAYIDPEHYIQFFDDFFGDTLNVQFSGAKGTDAQAIAPTIVVSGALAAKGHVALVSGDTVTPSQSLSILTKSLCYKPSYGEIYMKTAIVIDDITSVAINVGFTDVLATTTLEEPFSISGTTITSNATDAACFVFDTAQTNDFWHIQGVKDGTDTDINNTGIAPIADTTITIEMIISEAGHAEFIINGQSYGIVANAVTPTVLLTPVISIMARTTATRTLWADYLLITQSRSKSIA